MLDSRSRRIRFREPTPIGTLVPQERDKLIFAPLRTHGPLTSKHLYKFHGGDESKFLNRLGKLYDFGYLTRPKEYWECYNAAYQPLVYDLTPKALAFLGKPGITRTDHAIHRLMCSCVMASIELACKAKDIGFISREEVTGGGSMRFQLSRKQNRDFLEPDEVFGLHFKDKQQKHYYAVEIDRGTEKIESDRNRKTIEDMFSAYEEIFEDRPYEEQWGRKNLHCLVVTTNRARAETMKKLAGRKIHIQVREDFATPWRMPPIYEDVLDGLV